MIGAVASMLSRFKERLADPHPAYFALVMATGIVSIAVYLVEMWPIAWTS
jgi:hypothetical protein